MRMLSKLVVSALISAAVATLLAITVNVVTSESVPAPFDVLKPYAIWLMLGLWLLTAMLVMLQELPRLRTERQAGFLTEPQRQDQATGAVRERLKVLVDARIKENRLFPQLPRLPQVWQSATTSQPKVRLATDAFGTADPASYVRTLQEVPSRRLVVCGAAGTGKTEWLYTYAQAALREQGPVPLLLELSQWPRDTPFQEWASTQLRRLFPELAVLAGTKDRSVLDAGLINALLLSKRFVLLLDGLDEVAPARRADLLRELDSGLWLEQAMVLTTRPEAYPDYTLRRAAVITILPLAVKEVRVWLAGAFPSTKDTERWAPVQRALRAGDSPVTTALSTPLMATLAAKVFEDPASRPADLADTVAHPTPESITGRLLSGLVPAAYGRPGRRARWAAGEAHSWLEFLATHTRRGGIAWWRMYQLVPRWRFAIYLGLLIGVGTAIAASYLTWLSLGALPTNLPRYDTWDFIQQPRLILQSWVENSVRTLSGRSDPSRAVTAMVVGSAVAAAATGWMTGSLLGPRERVWWQRLSWPSTDVDRRRPDTWWKPVRDIGYGVAISALAGGATGAVGAAVASALLPLGDGTSALFWLSALVGAKVGVAIGAAVGLYSTVDGEPPLPWNRLSPTAPATLRIGFPSKRLVTLVVAGGVLLGTAVALVLGRSPGQAALFGALIAVGATVWFVADDLTEQDGPGPAENWQADGTERPTALLRDDLRASAIRLAAAAVLTAPMLIPQAGPLHPDIARALVTLFLLYWLIRELSVRSWSWWLVAVLALAIRRRLPWSILSFLDDARGKNVLRLEGATYHFRHGELADWLSRQPSEPEPVVTPAPANGGDQRTTWQPSRVDDAYREDLDRADDLIARGEHTEARDRLDALLLRARKADDEDAVLVIRALLAEILAGEGKRRAAVAELNRVLRAQLTLSDQDNIEVVYTRLRLAVLLTGQRGIDQVDAILAARPPGMSPQDPVVVQTHLRGAELHEKGDQLYALHHATMAEHGLPSDGRLTARTKEQQLESKLRMILAFAPPGERPDALAELFGDACTAVGADHSHTITIRVELARACGKAGRWTEAEEHWLAITEWAAVTLPTQDRSAADFRKQLHKVQRRRRF